jgi:hypothetical protein
MATINPPPASASCGSVLARHVHQPTGAAVERSPQIPSRIAVYERQKSFPKLIGLSVLWLLDDVAAPDIAHHGECASALFFDQGRRFLDASF